MGYAKGWTDLECENPQPFPGWGQDPADIGETPRVIKGQPKRKERLRCLGNALVPQIAEYIGLRLKALEG